MTESTARSDDEGAGEGGGEPPFPIASVPAVSSRGRGWVRAAYEAIRSVVLVLLVFAAIRTFAVEAFKIPTSSMEGTLLAGDFLLVNKAVYGAELPGVGLQFPAFSEPDRWDVIVFHPPHEPAKHYVKRVVGMPGDTLEMRGKQLFLNGESIEEPWVRHSDVVGDAVHPGMAWQSRYLRDGPRPGRYRPSRDSWGPLVVPTGRYFVLGDNRDNSEDSRYWGFVEREMIKGRPWIVYYSSVPADRTVGTWLREIRWKRIGGRIQ